MGNTKLGITNLISFEFVAPRLLCNNTFYKVIASSKKFELQLIVRADL